MNFLLVDIGYDCEELNEPLGIEVLYSYLKKYVCDVNIICYSVNLEGDNYKKLFDSCKPDIVAVSTHINTSERMDRLYYSYLEYSADQGKNPIIVVGGILGTYDYKSILSKYHNTICSIGEGEISLLQIINIAKKLDGLNFESLISNIQKKECDNLAYYFNDKIVVKPRTVIQDLTEADYSVTHKYLRSTLCEGGIARIEASRGCVWNKCSFCVLAWKYAGTAWRPYSLEKVISEIINVAREGAHTIYFTDEEFIAGDYYRIQDFIQKIKLLKHRGEISENLEFVASTSVHALLGKYGMTKDEVETCLVGLKEIGFRSFFLGIESGCNMQLKRFRKGTTVKDNEDALHLLKKYSIEADVGYILFDPLLTVSELAESLEFLKRNELEGHISRFAKRLRLVPYTSYCKFDDLMIQQYDNDAVEINYQFMDHKIQKIYDCYAEWEKKHLSITHTVQAKIRATISSEERNDYMEQLSEIRRTEYLVLSRLVSLALVASDFDEMSTEEICLDVFNY